MKNSQKRFRNFINHSATNIPSSIPGADDITRVELDNGITVLARSNFNSLSVTLSGYLTAGGLFDPDDKLGLADFTASALMRGSSQRDFQGIYNALESVGASFGFSGATHTTGFGGRALAEDLDLLLDILSETVVRPTFPSEQVQRLKAQLLTGLAIRAQDTREMASLTFDQMIYKNHPYSRPEDGYPETVEIITREDLKSFHETHYGPRGMVIAVVGAVEPQIVVESIQRKLGDWKNPSQKQIPDLPAVTPLEQQTKEMVEIPGMIQSDIVIGLPGPPHAAPEFLPAVLGNNILGQFGMMGRIGHAVREQAGLAYYAYSDVSGGLGPGPWSVLAGVNPVGVNQAVALILNEIQRFVSEPVTQEELENSQSSYIGRLPLALESNAGVAAAILNLERYQRDLDYYRRYKQTVKAVTVEKVLATAQKYLHSERLAIAIAGPKISDS
jgi:zinc protease